jgi:RND family efflux transporter MFP subunit
VLLFCHKRADRRIIFLMGVMSSIPYFSLEGTEVDGFTEPYRDIDVAASEMGVITSIEVREGERVTVGQLLGKLDDDSLQASLEIAKAEVSAKGKLDALGAELEMQRDMLRRVEFLHGRQHANEQEVLRARTQQEVLQSQLRTLHEDLSVRALEAKRIEVQITRRKLLSPIEGIVTKVHKDVGEFASPNDPIVFNVVQLDPLLVVFAVPAAVSKNLEVDRSATVVIDGRAHEGQIETVAPTADPQSNTVRVRVRLPNPQEQILSGISCFLRIPEGNEVRTSPSRQLE